MRTTSVPSAKPAVFGICGKGTIMSAKSILRSAAFCAAAISFSIAVPNAAYALVKLDFSKYGKTTNTVCPAAPGGICAAAAAINSFTFLQNTHPDLYKGKITPNLQADGTDPKDALAFADYYYKLGAEKNEWLDTFMTSKKWWIDGKAPGTTIYSSMYLGSAYNNDKPGFAFLEKELKDGEDIEFFVSFKDKDGKELSHALTLYGIDTTKDAMKIWYQDPNDPTTEYERGVTLTDGYLSFKGLYGFGDDVQLTVYAAFAESAVPEIGTWLMMVAGFGGVGFSMRRRRGRTAIRIVPERAAA
jgi:hypothetical protein